MLFDNEFTFVDTGIIWVNPILFFQSSCRIWGFRSMESFRPVIALRRFYTEYNAIYVRKLHTKMYQNTYADFKLGYVDAKSDAIAFCVKTYPSGSFIKNLTNMHDMQNRMKIAFCVKPPLPSILLADKGGPT